MIKKNIIFKFFLFSIFILIIFPLVLPFLGKGYFTTHDGEWAIVRLAAYHFSLKDGQFPPRWTGNLFHTYGYPVLNFNYPLPPMIGEMFHLLGLGFVNSVKLVFILSIILSALFMYLLIRVIFGRLAGIFSVVLYIYYPFRMVDLFVRGSPGESLIFVCLPFAWWSLYKLNQTRTKKWLAISSLSLALLILAHNSLAFATLPFIIIYLIFLITRSHSSKYFLGALSLGLALSCFFWLPALYEKQWTILKPEIITKPTEHFPSLKQLIIPSDSLSFQLGPLHLIIFLISIPLAILRKKSELIRLLLLITAVNIFFLLPTSSFFWNKIPLIVYMSYPWRLLVPIGFYFAFIAGWFISLIKPNNIKIVLIFLSFLLLFIITIQNRQITKRIDKDDMFYITNQSTTIEGDENTPVWVKIAPQYAPKEKIEFAGYYEILKQKSNLLEFKIKSDQPGKVIINTIYYPGWQIYLNGLKTDIDYKNDPMGRLSFNTGKGDFQVKAVFSETPLRMISDIISLISLIIFLILFL